MAKKLKNFPTSKIWAFRRSKYCSEDFISGLIYSFNWEGGEGVGGQQSKSCWGKGIEEFITKGGGGNVSFDHGAKGG